MAEMENSAHAVKRIGKRVGLAALPATVAFVSLFGVANAFSGSHVNAASGQQSPSGIIEPYGQIMPYSSSPDNFINV